MQCGLHGVQLGGSAERGIVLLIKIALLRNIVLLTNIVLLSNIVLLNNVVLPEEHQCFEHLRSSE